MIRTGLFFALIFLLYNFSTAQKIGTIAPEQTNVSNEITQKEKTVILNLKNGYTVKGVIVSQTDQAIKIRTQAGEVFDYPTDQIDTISEQGMPQNKREKNSSGIGQKENIVFNKGDKVLNAGLGFGAEFKRSYFSQTNRIPPIIASYEMGVKDELFDKNSTLGIGAIGGFTREWNKKYDYGYTYFFIGLKGSIHYQLIENLDTYGGLILGLEFFGVNSSQSNELTQSFLLGGRYYLSDNLGTFLEFGVGMLTYGNIGIAVKF
jgi:hypothetical protein